MSTWWWNLKNYHRTHGTLHPSPSSWQLSNSQNVTSTAASHTDSLRFTTNDIHLSICKRLCSFELKKVLILWQYITIVSVCQHTCVSRHSQLLVMNSFWRCRWRPTLNLLSDRFTWQKANRILFMMLTHILFINIITRYKKLHNTCLTSTPPITQTSFVAESLSMVFSSSFFILYMMMFNVPNNVCAVVSCVKHL